MLQVVGHLVAVGHRVAVGHLVAGNCVFLASLGNSRCSFTLYSSSQQHTSASRAVHRNLLRIPMYSLQLELALKSHKL